MDASSDRTSGTPADRAGERPPLIEARRVSVTFPGVRALAEVDFDVRPGEVHALIGENGAGKSTLIRVLSGDETAYAGEVRLDGRPVRFSSPREGVAAGIAVIGGIDLSVGSVLALAATLTGSLLMTSGLGVWPTLAIVLLVGCFAGLLNGLVVARWRLQAFIATLATMSAARGVARYLSGGTAIPLGFGPNGAPGAFRAVAAPIVPYVPVPAVLFLLSVGAIWVLMARMRAGRYIYAIGDNEQAARLSGVPVARYKALVYVICAGLAALAGLIHCAQLEQGNPNDGVGYELDAIAAVVIGGTSLSGGVGTVGGTLVGTLIIGIINNSMGLNNIDANLQLILKGVIILAAVWVQTRRR